MSLQAAVFAVRRPYHDRVLPEEGEIKGAELLGNATFKSIEKQGFSYQYNLAEELLQFTIRARYPIFAVVCFDPGFHSFACRDEALLDRTFKCLLSRVNRYAECCNSGAIVKLVFDDRTHTINRDNAKAITNFLVKSPVGRGYTNILPYPFFAVSQAHNYGLQLADVLVTVIAKHFAGDKRIDALWNLLYGGFVSFQSGNRRWKSLKVLDPDKNKK